MARLLVVALAGVFLAGCATQRVDLSRPISKDLPLSFIDLAEIREGSEKHQEILKEKKLLQKTELQQYVSNIGRRLASVSGRPHLPYQFFILDEDKVDVFSVGGGYVYLTRGMLEFVDSEAELAAVLAHEIAHVAAGVHTPGIGEQPNIKGKVLKQMLKAGAGAAGGAVGGPAGTAAGAALGGIGAAMPEIRKRFEKNQEMEADAQALRYLVDTQYDPRELVRFVEKLSQVDIPDIVKYIYLLNSHPPYEERREKLRELIKQVNFNKTQFKLNQERFSSIRLVTIQYGSVQPEFVTPPVTITNVEASPIAQTAKG
jgi:predicted Zn-dependent protease